MLRPVELHVVSGRVQLKKVPQQIVALDKPSLGSWPWALTCCPSLPPKALQIQMSVVSHLNVLQPEGPHFRGRADDRNVIAFNIGLRQEHQQGIGGWAGVFGWGACALPSNLCNMLALKTIALAPFQRTMATQDELCRGGNGGLRACMRPAIYMLQVVRPLGDQARPTLVVKAQAESAPQRWGAALEAELSRLPPDHTGTSAQSPPPLGFGAEMLAGARLFSCAGQAGRLPSVEMWARLRGSLRRMVLPLSASERCDMDAGPS